MKSMLTLFMYYECGIPASSADSRAQFVAFNAGKLPQVNPATIANPIVLQVRQNRGAV